MEQVKHRQLYEAIEARGMRHAWLARHILGITRAAFWWRLHRGDFSTSDRVKLAAHLGTSVEALFPDGVEERA